MMVMKELLVGVVLFAPILLAQCQDLLRCFDGDINFSLLNYESNGPLTTVEGPVEVCINGSYESVCDIGWDQNDAEALCRYEVGSSVVAETLSGLGTPRTTYASRTYNCSEYDYGLRFCNYASTIDPQCHNGEHVAGVRCREVCTTGDVRLTNSTFSFDNDLGSYRGRVDICVNETFLPICDLGWDKRDAQVACRYIYGSSYVGEVVPSFPLSPSSRFIAQDMMCNGTEYSFRECDYNPPSSPECYSAGNRSAAVACRQVCSEGDVRLVNQTYTSPNGLNSVSGVVQVCINQQYVYVCSDNWDDREAEVICNSISSSYEAPYYVNTASMTSGIFGDAPIYRYSMCNGTERRFRDCQLPRNESSSTCPSLATVNCTEVISRCYSDGNFQLFNAETSFDHTFSLSVSGRIEVCSNRSYKSLCYQNWDSLDADVFCKYYMRNYYGYSPEDISGQISLPSQYVPGIAGYAPHDVMCNGSESSVNDCDISNGTISDCENSTFGAAGVICTARGAPTITLPPTICQDFDLRLSNSTFYLSDAFYNVYEGNVEVCLGGTFFSICDVGWDDQDAQTACNDLGYIEPIYRGVALNGLRATSLIAIENVSCPVNASVSQCSSTPPQSSRCFNNFSAAGVRCVQERLQCFTEGEITLVDITYDNYLAVFSGGEFSFSGRVGVCQNRVYGSVCDVDWDQNDAASMCNSFVTPTSGGMYESTPLYGLDSGPYPIILESVDCTGTEGDISSCPTSTIGQISDPSCRQSDRAAGATCRLKPGSCINNQARLVDGPSYYEGRVEVCIDNRWLTVCETGFDTVAADSVCTERLLLDGESTPVYGNKYGSGTGPILTVCPTSFSSYSVDFTPIANCSSVPLNLSCSAHELDVSVRCSKGQVAVSVIPVGNSRHGSTSFALQGSASQFPWNATVVSSGWYDIHGNQISESSSGGPVRVDVLQDMYNTANFNFTYTFISQLTFDHPLTVGDAGYYIFNVTLRVTYLDNSTAVISNSTAFPLVLEVPPPTVTITSEDTPISHRPYTATCTVTFEAAVPLRFVAIRATTPSGLDLARFIDSVSVSSIRQINNRTFARDLTVNPITEADSGGYVCEAAVVNNYTISHPGSAYINISVLPAPLPPPEVIGLCTNVVWYAPVVVSCDSILGYDVRLFHPQSASHPNVTRRVGSNATFYVLRDNHRMGRSRGDLYFQVRVIHSSGVGEWSEGTSLGCETPTTMPDTPSVYFEVNGDVYLNNSAVPISVIGEGERAIYCRTNKEDCCGTIPNRFGEFYYPNGVKVPVAGQFHGFYRNRGDQIVRLNRREGVVSPTGKYRCEVPTAEGEVVKIYITLTSE